MARPKAGWARVAGDENIDAELVEMRLSNARLFIQYVIDHQEMACGSDEAFSAIFRNAFKGGYCTQTQVGKKLNMSSASPSRWASDDIEKRALPSMFHRYGALRALLLCVSENQGLSAPVLKL